MMERQHTLNNIITLEGIGLHTGQYVSLLIRPAGSHKGYTFIRTDVAGNPTIKADPDLVVSTERGTTLEDNGVRVHTTEHLLAALAGTGVDNAIIEINGPEVPILDGSSKPFVEAILTAGLAKQAAIRQYIEIDEPITLQDPSRKTEMSAVPSELYQVSVTVDYESPALGMQQAQLEAIQHFPSEIAPNRTFCFFREIAFMAKNNLIKGGDIDNAIVLVEHDQIDQDELDALASLLGKNLKHVKSSGLGVLNSTELRFENEPARHKLLDVVGDLALLGKPIKGHIFAERPGHATNVEFARLIKKKMIKNKSNTEVRMYDPGAEAIYDVNGIMKLLPHRYPFLLVDKVIELNDEGVVGVKNISINEPFFMGHFPGNPVFPGVLQIEAMAQCGGIFALSQVEEPEEYSTYFMKISEVKFKKKVIPGDALVMELLLLTPIRRGIVHMKGTCYVNGQVVSEAVMMAQIVKDSRNG